MKTIEDRINRVLDDEIGIILDDNKCKTGDIAPLDSFAYDEAVKVVVETVERLVRNNK